MAPRFSTTLDLLLVAAGTQSAVVNLFANDELLPDLVAESQGECSQNAKMFGLN